MRETATVRIPAFPGTRNRDLGKVFRLTEWPAARAEQWAMKIVLAANKGATPLPLNVSGMGMEGIAALGINAFFLSGNAQPETLIPLMDELLECVTIIRDPKHPDVVMPLLPDDLEEIATRFWLRGEVLSLHLGFSVSDALSALWRKMMTPVQVLPELSTPPTSAPESPPPSDPS